MDLKLPESVTLYFESAANGDPEIMSACFADDAMVRDEGHEHRGIAAIKAWKQKTSEQYQYTVKPLEAYSDSDALIVRAHVAGNFPGSPIQLEYAFTLTNGRITSLETR